MCCCLFSDDSGDESLKSYNSVAEAYDSLVIKQELDGKGKIFIENELLYRLARCQFKFEMNIWQHVIFCGIFKKYTKFCFR